MALDAPLVGQGSQLLLGGARIMLERGVHDITMHAQEPL
eukprot:CAMPEP_0179018420 /NCGR_PEP_ID=MMETSP0796-20121207/4344_1 /TAXON_ID=73915 /ORGANISM="Pyrodinium bahamense, Strain pbaha01" /LENGTH=38 /DNA_ID= /DNA_START= /DNA_END= /DNA_ORIENTATION=